MGPVTEEVVELARRSITHAQRVVVLTGAGISTDSGIPDFRGPNGVWTKNPKAERASDIRYYLADPEVRVAAWQNRLATPIWEALPNAGHRALVDLERGDRLHTLVTQNIDGLHHDAGSDPGRIVEVHGTVRWTRCMDCGDRRSMVEALDRVRSGEDDPPCLVCGGIIKSDTISFGQQLVAADIERAMAAASEADLLLAVGSTLSVYPVANMVPIAAQAGATVVIVNGAPTEMDEFATHRVEGAISDLLPEIVR